MRALRAAQAQEKQITHGFPRLAAAAERAGRGDAVAAARGKLAAIDDVYIERQSTRSAQLGRSLLG